MSVDDVVPLGRDVLQSRVAQRVMWPPARVRCSISEPSIKRSAAAKNCKKADSTFLPHSFRPKRASTKPSVRSDAASLEMINRAMPCKLPREPAPFGPPYPGVTALAVQNMTPMSTAPARRALKALIDRFSRAIYRRTLVRAPRTVRRAISFAAPPGCCTRPSPQSGRLSRRTSETIRFERAAASPLRFPTRCRESRPCRRRRRIGPC